MSISKTIPIQAERATQTEALKLAANEIRNTLLLFYPADLIDQSQAHKIVAGMWFSRVPGFHSPDDFWHLARDFLFFAMSGERSSASDRLAYTFSGFMPSYGAASTCLSMIQDGANWQDVQAFMHHLAYGDARRYIASFDWAGGQRKAQEEVDAWRAILNRQCEKLGQLMEAEQRPILLAQAQPQPGFPTGPMTDIPPAANDPFIPKPKPPLRIVPPRELPTARPVPVPPWWLRLSVYLLPLLISGDTRRDDALVVEDYAPEASATTGAVNNECLKQTDANKKNGEVCENDGYVLMERHLLYKRLIDPPKGKGLDGLFEKQAPADHPNPMPEKVWQPRGGKLVFLPTTSKPPKAQYDQTGKPPQTIYPKFVVFEAKNIAQNRDPETNPQGVLDEAKRRLLNTCDGMQTGTVWTEKRVPRALKRGIPDKKDRIDKSDEIDLAGYSRWVFVCLPASDTSPISIGSKIERIYVLIDVATAPGWEDLDKTPPRTRKPRAPAPDNTF